MGHDGGDDESVEGRAARGEYIEPVRTRRIERASARKCNTPRVGELQLIVVARGYSREGEGECRRTDTSATTYHGVAATPVHLLREDTPERGDLCIEGDLEVRRPHVRIKALRVDIRDVGVGIRIAHDLDRVKEGMDIAPDRDIHITTAEGGGGCDIDRDEYRIIVHLAARTARQGDPRPEVHRHLRALPECAEYPIKSVDGDDRVARSLREAKGRDGIDTGGAVVVSVYLPRERRCDDTIKARDAREGESIARAAYLGRGRDEEFRMGLIVRPHAVGVDTREVFRDTRYPLCVVGEEDGLVKYHHRGGLIRREARHDHGRYHVRVIADADIPIKEHVAARRPQSERHVVGADD